MWHAEFLRRLLDIERISSQCSFRPSEKAAATNIVTWYLIMLLTILILIYSKYCFEKLLFSLFPVLNLARSFYHILQHAYHICKSVSEEKTRHDKYIWSKYKFIKHYKSCVCVRYYLQFTWFYLFLQYKTALCDIYVLFARILIREENTWYSKSFF